MYQNTKCGKYKGGKWNEFREGSPGDSDGEEPFLGTRVSITSSPNGLGALSALTLTCVNRVCLRIIFVGDVPILYILVAGDVIYIQGMTYKSFYSNL